MVFRYLMMFEMLLFEPTLLNKVKHRLTRRKHNDFVYEIHRKLNTAQVWHVTLRFMHLQ